MVTENRFKLGLKIKVKILKRFLRVVEELEWLVKKDLTVYEDFLF